MKKLLKILKAKKIFFPPKEKKNLILDSSQSFIFSEYLNKNETEILHTRYEELNLYIIFKNLFNFKFTFKDYIIEYIKYTKCKQIISFIENNIFYYQLKEKFPEIKIILIQNGMRTKSFFKKLSDLKNLKVNYLFTFSEFYKSKFQSRVEGKVICLGSFKNNMIRNITKKKERNLIFISSGPLFENSMGIFGDKRIDSKKYFHAEKILLPIALDFCKKNKLDLKILARSKNNKHLKYEKNFYNNIISSNEFEFLENKEWKQSYQFIDKAKLVMTIYSALGLESLARGNRTIFFNVRNIIVPDEDLNLFSSTKKIATKGQFWTNEITKEEINRVAQNGILYTDEEWKKSLSDLIPNLIDYDFHNKKFSEILD